MTYKEHNHKLCDKCQENPKKWKFPFLYKDMNDKTHRDLGGGYRQYEVCDSCKELEERILRAQGNNDVVWKKC